MYKLARQVSELEDFESTFLWNTYFLLAMTTCAASYWLEKIELQLSLAIWSEMCGIGTAPFYALFFLDKVVLQERTYALNMPSFVHACSNTICTIILAYWTLNVLWEDEAPVRRKRRGRKETWSSYVWHRNSSILSSNLPRT